MKGHWTAWLWLVVALSCAGVASVLTTADRYGLASWLFATGWFGGQCFEHWQEIMKPVKK